MTGCACDIPSVNYQFSWKIKLWTHYYSYSPEIWEYLKNIYDENDFVNKYVKLKHQIERAEWNNEKGKWIFQVRDIEKDRVFEDEADYYVNAGGVLNKFKWPKIEGLESYKGKLMHSAQYEEGFSLEGKKVAVLGAGSSGVQIVAKIQQKVDTLYHWIRNPIWITAGFAQTWAGKDGANFAYTPEQLDFLDKNPKKYLEYRKQVSSTFNASPCHRLTNIRLRMSSINASNSS
jgi:cation diffusion facilitator CzcD-associated flavoprotein CzcO